MAKEEHSTGANAAKTKIFLAKVLSNHGQDWGHGYMLALIKRAPQSEVVRGGGGYRTLPAAD